MSNELRVRSGFQGGLIEDNPLTAGATTLTSAGLAAVPVIGSTQHMAVVLDPDGFAGNPEIAYITAHSAAATTATILRAQEGTTARAHDRDMPWVHSVTVYDFATWQLVVDEPGTSLANWTTVAGTWTAASGYIEQTDATAAYRGLKYNSLVHTGAGLIVEAEIRFPTTGLSSRRAMIAPASGGAVGSTHDLWAGLQCLNNTIVQQGDQATLTKAATVIENVWYRTRLSLLGDYVTVEKDGVVAGSFVVSQGTGVRSTDTLMLVTYQTGVHYRNIKVWRKWVNV